MIPSQVNVILVCTDAHFAEEFALKNAYMVITPLNAAASHLVFICLVL